MLTLTWNEIIKSLPAAHFLQTREWADIKQAVGWESEELTWSDDEGRVTGAAQLLVRSMRLLGIGPRISIGYIPRGPMIEWQNNTLRKQVLQDIEIVARKKKLVFVKIDPEVVSGTGVSDDTPGSSQKTGSEVIQTLKSRGWRYSPEQIQFKNTMMLDLSGSEEELLGRMKQKTRYNVRLAMKAGVTVRRACQDELPLLYKMYAETADRDGFIIRPESYYLEVWSKFILADMAEALIAEYEGTILAGLIYFFLNDRAWYVYGMSSNQQREKMPNYLLQWEAMRSAKTKGCTQYDLWGAPDTFDSTDAMYGVYRFKEGLGAQVIRTIGAWDYKVRPVLNFMYHRIIPQVLSFTRRIRRKQLKQEVVV